jgi:hypothetical protein
MNYREEIIKMIRRIENKEYLKYIYILLKTFLEN